MDMAHKPCYDSGISFVGAYRRQPLVSRSYHSYLISATTLQAIYVKNAISQPFASSFEATYTIIKIFGVSTTRYFMHDFFFLFQAARHKNFFLVGMSSSLLAPIQYLLYLVPKLIPQCCRSHHLSFIKTRGASKAYQDRVIFLPNSAL